MQTRSRRRKGFTLLELLLVMAILVVLASLAGFSVMSMRAGALSRAAFVQIQSLEDQCKAYKLNVGNYPNTLDDLHIMPSGLTAMTWGGPYLDDPVPMDPWNNPYNYTKDELNDRVTITSNGKDGQSGTQDDIPQVQ